MSSTHLHWRAREETKKTIMISMNRAKVCTVNELFVEEKRELKSVARHPVSIFKLVFFVHGYDFL